MNCPICNKELISEKANNESFCDHYSGSYVIGYDTYGVEVPLTSIYFNKTGKLALRLKGLVYVDEGKIEKLLLLK